jgi:hypothetical protein
VTALNLQLPATMAYFDLNAVELTGLTISSAAEKGRKLMAKVLADDQTAGSMFDPPRDAAASGITTKDLYESGYVPYDNPDTSSRVEDFELDVLPALGSDSSIAFWEWNIRCGHNWDSTWRHEIQTMQDGKLCEPTNADFHNIVNPIAGLLIAVNNINPAAMAKQMLQKRKPSECDINLPRLRNWSDVAFLQWQRVAKRFSVRGTALKYIVRSNVANPNTLDIMSQVLGEYAGSRNIPECRDDFVPRPRWPGVDFDIDSDEGLALLSTPYGNSIGWLLAQHKRELGHRVISKVTIFFHETVDQGLQWEDANLLFHIKEADD